MYCATMQESKIAPILRYLRSWALGYIDDKVRDVSAYTLRWLGVEKGRHRSSLQTIHEGNENAGTYHVPMVWL